MGAPGAIPLGSSAAPPDFIQADGSMPLEWYEVYDVILRESDWFVNLGLPRPWTLAVCQQRLLPLVGSTWLEEGGLECLPATLWYLAHLWEVSALLCHGPEPQPTEWQCREVKISTILNLNKFSSGWSSWSRTGSELFTRKIDCKMFSWVLRRWGRGALAWSPRTSTVKSWELLSGESWRWGDVVWETVGEWQSCSVCNVASCRASVVRVWLGIALNPQVKRPVPGEIVWILYDKNVWGECILFDYLCPFISCHVVFYREFWWMKLTGANKESELQ